jgi:hypothetical protein
VTATWAHPSLTNASGLGWRYGKTDAVTGWYYAAIVTVWYLLSAASQLALTST